MNSKWKQYIGAASTVLSSLFECPLQYGNNQGFRTGWAPQYLPLLLLFWNLSDSKLKCTFCAGSHPENIDSQSFSWGHVLCYHKASVNLGTSRGDWFVWQEGGRGLYMQFCNMLINDSIYLLDESLKKVEDIREIELQKKRHTEWNQLPPSERQRQERQLSDLGIASRG